MATTTSSSSTRTESYPSSSSANAPVQSKTTPTDGTSASSNDAPSPRLMDTSGSDAFAEHGSPTTAGATGSSPATNDGKNVDNTKNNERDRHGTLTPGNQGNSNSETKITADVRKGLMSSKSLSFTAKNAKIITVGTKVTLRGVVKTDAEKAEIESVAKATNGVTDVDNQLEVKK